VLEREPSRFIAEMGLDRAFEKMTDLLPEQKAQTPQERISALKALLRKSSPV